TSANSFGGRVRVTHYALGRKRCLSKSGPGGNSAGNFRPRSAKALNPLRNSSELVHRVASDPKVRVRAHGAQGGTGDRGHRRHDRPRLGYEAVLPARREGAMKIADERMLQCNATNPFGFSSPSARVD